MVRTLSAWYYYRQKHSKVQYTYIILIKKLLYILSFLIPFYAYFIFIIIRDPRFISYSLKGPNMNNSEFFGVSQFCVDVPMCFRVSSSYLGQIIYIIENFLLSLNPNFLNPFYTISGNEYNAFLNIFSSFTFRALIFLGVIILLKSLFKDTIAVILLSSLSFIFLSHYFHLLVLRFFFGSVLQLPDMYMVVLKNIILMYVIYYDYVNLLLSLFIVWLIAQFNTSKRNYPIYIFFLLGFIFTSFFEHLGILLMLSFLFQSFRNNLVKASMALFGSLFYLVIFLFYVNLNQSQTLPKSRGLISTYLFYFNNNLQNINLVLVQLFLMLVFPALIGIIISYFISRFKYGILIDRNILNSFKSVLYAYLCIYLFAFFSSGIAGEFTRQALPFAFLTIIYFSVNKSSIKSKM
jgi:hypothetical protein